MVSGLEGLDGDGKAGAENAYRDSNGSLPSELVALESETKATRAKRDV